MFVIDCCLTEYYQTRDPENIILALINQLEYNKYHNINNKYSFENDIIKRTAIIFSIAKRHYDITFELIKLNKPIDPIIINYCFEKDSKKALDMIKKTNESDDILEISDKTPVTLINKKYDEYNFGAVDAYNSTILSTIINKIPREGKNHLNDNTEPIDKKDIIIKLIAIGLDFSIPADQIEYIIDKFKKPPYSETVYGSYKFSYILQCEYAYARRRHVIIELNTTYLSNL